MLFGNEIVEVKNTIILLILFLFSPFLKGQHYPVISQYMFSGLVTNPAYAGSRDALSVTGIYRKQWVGFDAAPQTQSLFFHSPTLNSKNNYGLSLVHDRLGVSQHTMVYGVYAYRIPLEKGRRLAFGLQGGVSMLKDKWTNIVTEQQGDDVFSADSPTFLVPRFGAGVYYDSERWYMGLSAPFLLDYKNSDYRLYTENSHNYRPFLLSTGFLIRLNPDLLLKPSLLAKYLPNSPLQADINLNLIIKDAFWIGASYRSRDAIVGLLEYQVNRQLRFGYAYDYSITDLRRFNSGSHEIMVRYEFGYQIKAMSPRYF